jgi:hypothetical protein
MVLSGYGGLVLILLAGKRTMIAPEYNSDQRAPPVNHASWIRADHIPQPRSLSKVCETASPTSGLVFVWRPKRSGPRRTPTIFGIFETSNAALVRDH